MSHFTVLIIGSDIKGQLAPFQENNMGDCPKKHLEFHDVEDEYRKQFEEEGTEMVRCEDGELAYRWDERFRIPGTFGQGSDTHKIPSHLKEEIVKHKDRYELFDQFMENWAGYEKDEVLGRYGYWKNPNAKWDWYEVGGRWTGFFKLKPGVKGRVGKPGLMTPRAELGFADSAIKRDIDFDSMRDDEGKKAGDLYDKAMKIIGHLPANKTWEEVLNEYDDEAGDKARDAYWKQERCTAWQKAEKDMGYSKWPFGYGIDPDDFLITREQYVQNARDGAGVTFAVIKDGKWFERGSMGWWATVTDEKDRETWNSMFSKMLDEVSPNTRLTVVDCHI